MGVKYNFDGLFWIIGDNGEVIEDIGGFIDFISPLIIIGEVAEECN